MYLVTNDPLQYLVWFSIIATVGLFALVIAWSVIRFFIWEIRWGLTNPPIHADPGTYVTLKSRKLARIDAAYPNGDLLVTIDPFNTMSLIERVHWSETRKF